MGPRIVSRRLPASIVAVVLVACVEKKDELFVSEPATAGADRSAGLRAGAGPVSYEAPADWIVLPPKPPMRLAQWRLPGAGGDSEDGQVVLYFFGAGQGGGVQANLDRWIGQMTQPDGGSSSEVARTEDWKQDTVAVTLVDVSGTFEDRMPGASEGASRPGFRMIAAVVEAPGGTVYAKATGPAPTIERFAPSIRRFLESMRGA
jgi:hypothetical protein